MANLNLKIKDVKNAEYIAGSVEDKIEEFENRQVNHRYAHKKIYTIFRYAFRRISDNFLQRGND